MSTLESCCLSLSFALPHAHEIHTWKWGIMAGLKTPLKINKILYYRKSWTENVLGVLKRFLCLQNKILAYMFGPRDDFQTFGWAKKLTLHSPPSSLKIISRTKHVCRDFVLWRKRFRTTSDVLRPRFPVVIYYFEICVLLQLTCYSVEGVRPSRFPIYKQGR